MNDDSPPNALDELDDDVVVEFDAALGVFTGAQDVVGEPVDPATAVTGPATAVEPRLPGLATGDHGVVGRDASNPLGFDEDLFDAIDGAVQRISGEFEAVPTQQSRTTGSWREIPSNRSTSRSRSGTWTAATRHEGETPRYAAPAVSAPIEVDEQQRTMQLDADDLMSISGLSFPVAPPPAPAAPARRSGFFVAVTDRETGPNAAAMAPTPLPHESQYPGDSGLAIDAPEEDAIGSPRAEATLERPAGAPAARFTPVPSEDPVSLRQANEPTASIERAPLVRPAGDQAPDDVLDDMLTSFFGSAPAASRPAANHAEHSLKVTAPAATPVPATLPMPTLDQPPRAESAQPSETRDPASATSRSDAFRAVPSASPGKPTSRVETLPLSSATQPAPEFTPEPAPEPDAERVEHSGYFDAAFDEPVAADPQSHRAAEPDADGEERGTANLLRAYLTGHELAVADTKPVPRVDTEDLLAAYLSDPLAMPPEIGPDDAVKKPKGRLIERPARSLAEAVADAKSKRRPRPGSRRSAIVEKTSGLSRSGEARRVGSHLEAAQARNEIIGESGGHARVTDFSDAFTAVPQTGSQAPISSDARRSAETSVEVWSPRAQHQSLSQSGPSAPAPRDATPAAPPHMVEEETRGLTVELSGAATADVLNSFADEIRPSSSVRRRPSFSVDRQIGTSEERAPRMPRMAPNSEDSDTIQITEQHAIDVLHEYINKRSQNNVEPSRSVDEAPRLQSRSGPGIPASTTQPTGGNADMTHAATREVQLSSSDADAVLQRYVDSVSRSGSHRAARGKDDD